MAQPHQSNFDGQDKLERVDRIVNDCLARRAAGEMIFDESLIAAHPDLMPELEEWLHYLRVIGKVAPPGRQHTSSSAESLYCPHCDTPLKVDDDTLVSEVVCSSCGASSPWPARAAASFPLDSLLPAPASRLPACIGRYRIESVLGKGAFGRVFLAYDEQLGRSVAVKVPHERLVANAEQAAAYLAEARVVANLDHPHIVPIHDVGSTDQFPCFLVCKHVEGVDLATILKKDRLTFLEAAELVATVAETLHYAHKQGLVHRDVKPGNILIGSDGTPYVVDFGLALRDENVGIGPRYAGTPAYMSPEQARGEGHRVDGRSDIFSLGVVLYEMLVGRRPFRAGSRTELLQSITYDEPKPLRQSNDWIPRELERICQKALAKRVRHRYDTASDFAEDLWQFLAGYRPTETTTAIQTRSSTELKISTAVSASAGVGDVSGSSTGSSSDSSLNSQPLKIVPKGLRSFDAHDADFFLELLPGPRDRHGLPDSIRFWKTRIESTDPDIAFRVGLIYGPSGCGKSSLFRAGLLPHLSTDVMTVYVEATPSGTERRVVCRLRRHCLDLPQDANLPAVLATLKKEHRVGSDKKVLIVLDQFEQWLHAHKQESETELVTALRQCDGVHLQCLVLVRDDFWLATTRFMRSLEVDLLQGHNSALVDLFDTHHARKVLAAFGRSFGKLPAAAKETTKQQKEFLKRSVRGLTREGKVVCVHLALFAEMMKGKPWTPETLQAVGGTQGVGVTFLEDTFSAESARPAYRLHQQAARNVLKALLPESGSDIKGQMKSYDELLKASGYALQPRDFDALMRILDSELRLITPTEQVGEGWSAEGEEDSPSRPSSNYQLTHDYLVPSLRTWLARKQQETRRGRAELCLEERAAFWKSKPENHLLPSWSEYLRISTLTSKREWNEAERRMMRRAGRVHALRWASFLVLAFAIAGVTQVGLAAAGARRLSEQAEALVDVVEKSRGDAVERAIGYLAALPQDTTVTHLKRHYRAHPNLSLAYALAGLGDVAVVDFLISKIPTASPIEVDNLRVALWPHRDVARDRLRTAVARAERAANLAKGNSTPDIKEATRQWRIMAHMAVVALHLGHADIAADVCQDQADASPRTIFIDEFSSWHGDLRLLAEKIETIADPSLRYSICLAVGCIDEWPPKQQQAKSAWTRLLAKWFRDHPDAGTHSGANWTLRKWGEELPEIERTFQPNPEKQWHFNVRGITMVKMLPGIFKRWVPPTANLEATTWPSGRPIIHPLEGETRELWLRAYWPTQRQPVRLSRPFWLSDREVSRGQFMEFMSDTTYPDEKKPPPFSDVELKQIRTFAPTDEYPMGCLSWFDAALFCNWLSHKDGLEPCYVRTGEVRGQNDVLDWNRKANGYRLPTVAEWEYACLAGTETIYFFGDQDDMLDVYCVHTSLTSILGGTKPEPCGTKAPNGWGLFNMLANAAEHCQDWYGVDARPQDTVTDPVVDEIHPQFLRSTRSAMAGAGVTFVHIFTRRSIARPDVERNLSGLHGIRVARSDSP